MPSARLTEAELIDITDYRQPAKQLAELKRQGFWRARRSEASGRVILERAHYEAVCKNRGGSTAPSTEGDGEPVWGVH